jgi:hypothetical protein
MTIALIQPIVSDFGPVGLLLVYLYLRDRRMAQAILQLAEEQPDVDEEHIEEQLRVPVPDKLQGD